MSRPVVTFTRSILLVITLCLGAPRFASATPVQFGSNYYELVIVLQPEFADGSANTWTLASASASASTFGGVNGHLATVGSASENAFLFGLASGLGLSGFQGAWLGGQSDGWLVGPDAGAFIYTNWGGTEPNNSGYAYMSIGTTGITPGTWADDSETQGLPEFPHDPVIGYFVEYENPRFEDAAAVPEPGTLTLFALGLAGMATRLRRRQ